MDRISKNDERGELGHICQYGYDNCDKLSRIVLDKTQFLAALAYCRMFTFIIAKNKFLFVLIIYIFEHDNVCDYVIKR